MPTHSAFSLASLLATSNHEQWFGEKPFDSRPYIEMDGQDREYLPVPYTILYEDRRHPKHISGSDLVSFLRDLPESKTIITPIYDGGVLEGYTRYRRQGSHFEATYEGEF
jgi:hypothetical protein